MTDQETYLLPDQLCVRLSTERLCLARYDAQVRTAFSFSAFHLNPQVSLTANLREAVRTEALMAAPWGEYVQAMVCAPATYVPLAEFQEEDCKAIYDLNFHGDKHRRVFYDIVAVANCMVLFSLPESTCHVLEETFGNVHFISSQTPLVRHFAGKGMLRPGQRRFFINVHSETVDLFVFEDARLLLANSYIVRNAVDAAYFVFGVARQLGAETASIESSENEHGSSVGLSTGIPFYVAGTEDWRRSVCAELRKYAANVLPINPGAEYHRHIVAMTPGVPYDLVTWLLDNR